MLENRSTSNPFDKYMRPPQLEIFPDSRRALSDVRSLIDHAFKGSLSENRQANLENQRKLEAFVSPQPDTVIAALATYLDSSVENKNNDNPFLTLLQDGSQLCVFSLDNSRQSSWRMLPVSSSTLTSSSLAEIMIVIHHPSTHFISIEALSNMISDPSARAKLEKYFTDYSVFIGDLRDNQSRRWSFGLPDLKTTDVLADLLDHAQDQYPLTSEVIEQFQPQLSDFARAANNQERLMQRVLLRHLLTAVNEQPAEFSYHENKLNEFANQASLFTSLFIEDFLQDDPQLNEVLAEKLAAFTGINLLKDPLLGQKPEIMLTMGGYKLETLLSETDWHALYSAWQDVLSTPIPDVMPSITLRNGWTVSVKLERTTSGVSFACLEMYMPDVSHFGVRIFVLPPSDVRGNLRFSSPQEMSRFLNDHFHSLLHSQLSSMWVGKISR